LQKKLKIWEATAGTGHFFLRVEVELLQDTQSPITMHLTHIGTLNLLGSKGIFGFGYRVIKHTVLVTALHLADKVGTVLAGTETSLDLVARILKVLKGDHGMGRFILLGISDIGRVLLLTVHLVGLSF